MEVTEDVLYEWNTASSQWQLPTLPWQLVQPVRSKKRKGRGEAFGTQYQQSISVSIGLTARSWYACRTLREARLWDERWALMPGSDAGKSFQRMRCMKGIAARTCNASRKRSSRLAMQYSAGLVKSAVEYRYRRDG